jgi:hypothetical protein
VPKIKTWVYDGLTHTQQDYVWQNKAQCNVMIAIPEDSCNALGTHSTTTRTVHKCEAMNDHGYNTELSGHMPVRALRSLRKLAAKNKNFGRKLSAGGNKHVAQKMQLRKLRQRQHFERRRRQLAEKGGRRLSEANEKLELLGVRYLMDNTKVVAPDTAKFHKLKATAVHHTVKRKLKSIKKKFGSLRKLTMRRK